MERPDGFDTVVINSTNKLMWHCMRMCNNNRTDAEDLFQHTMLKALTHPITTGQHDLSAWLYTIARNHRINEVNRLKQFHEVASDIRNIQASQISTNDYMQIATRNMLQVLSHDHQKTMSLYLNGYKYKEIADKLDIPIGTVKSRINTIRAYLVKTNGLLNTRL